jgi:hypothetical protein
MRQQNFFTFSLSPFKRNERAIYSLDDNLCTKPSVRLSVETERDRFCRNGRRQYQTARERSRPPPLFSTGISRSAAAASYCADKKFPVPFPCK